MITYEILTGVRPFCAESVEEVIENIINFNIEWPGIGYEEGEISPEAKEFIEKLLNKSFIDRLGSKGIE